MEDGGDHDIIVLWRNEVRQGRKTSKAKGWNGHIGKKWLDNYCVDQHQQLQVKRWGGVEWSPNTNSNRDQAWPGLSSRGSGGWRGGFSYRYFIQLKLSAYLHSDSQWNSFRLRKKTLLQEEYLRKKSWELQRRGKRIRMSRVWGWGDGLTFYSRRDQTSLKLATATDFGFELRQVSKS